MLPSQTRPRRVKTLPRLPWFAAVALLPLMVGAAAWTTVGTEAATVAANTAIPSDCGGGGNWPTKIGTDDEAGQVDLTSQPTRTTVAQLTSLPLPSPIVHRIRPTETTVYTVTARLTEVTQEHDRDFHLGLSDSSGHFMVAELPDPACVPPSSPFRSSISLARSQLAAWSGNPPATVEITGVGFFDTFTGQSDQAPNQIELHPILNLNFDPGSSPVVTTQPSDQRVTAGANATFTSVASGTPTPTVQWQVSANGGASFNDVGGATVTTLAVPRTTVAMSGRKYRAIFTNAGGRATSKSATLTVNAAPVGGVVLDGYGGLHPYGTGQVNIQNSTYWQGWDIARGVAVKTDGSGGFTLDGWGGVHAFGNAPTVLDGSHAYWEGWDIARGIALCASGTSGYTLDGWGGLHSFGGAPPVADSTHAYWPGWDIARSLVVKPDCTGGYILDGWGGIHAFGNAPLIADTSHAYWTGWDIARGLVLRADGHSGYTADGWGGIHPFGGAPTVDDSSHAYWQGWDIARGISLNADDLSGYTLDGWGGVHAFAAPGGQTPPAIADHRPGAYWQGWDIARGISGS